MLVIDYHLDRTVRAIVIVLDVIMRRGVKPKHECCGRLVARTSLIMRGRKMQEMFVTNFQETSSRVFENEHSVESRSNRTTSQIMHRRRGVEVYSRRCGRMVERIMSIKSDRYK